MIQVERDAQNAQILLDALKMSLTFMAKVISDLRCCSGYLLAVGLLTVEQAQRIPDESDFAVGAKAFYVLGIMLPQCFQVAGPAELTADTIQLNGNLA
jgi:hypothetical protein